MDRRTTLKWIMAAAIASRSPSALAAGASGPAQGYGTDPKLLQAFSSGQYWPLSFSTAQRRTAKALCDLIIPADATSPSASSVGVVEFIDEWISAPYERQREDRAVILKGLRFLETQSRRRFSHRFDQLKPSQMTGICDEICYEPRAAAALKEAARFFARFRDLTAAGFYTTPVGRADLKYLGNSPSTHFDGPPPEVLKQAGLE